MFVYMNAGSYMVNAHKNDGSLGLSTDNFISVGDDLFVNVAFLLTCVTVHVFLLPEFVVSTVIHINLPKKLNVNSS